MKFAAVLLLASGCAAKSVGYLGNLRANAQAPQQTLLSLVAAAANAKSDPSQFEVASLASLAQSLSKSGGVEETIQTIKGLVDGMLGSITSEANAAQAGVQNTSLYTQCTAQKGAAMADISALSGGTTESAAHAQCVKELTALNATYQSCLSQEELLHVTKEARCEYFASIDRSANFQSWFCHEDDYPESSSYESYLQRNIDMLAEFRTRKSNCTDATSSYNTKMAECQTKQTPVASKELQCATLESSATSALCAPYEGKLAVCKTYESCWSAAGSAAGNSLNTAQSIQDNLKTQWTALKRIQCLLDVLAKSGDQTAALTACIAKTHSTDSLTLTPAAAPTKEVCSAGTAPAACVA